MAGTTTAQIRSQDRQGSPDGTESRQWKGTRYSTMMMLYYLLDHKQLAPVTQKAPRAERSKRPAAQQDASQAIADHVADRAMATFFRYRMSPQGNTMSILRSNPIGSQLVRLKFGPSRRRRLRRG